MAQASAEEIRRTAVDVLARPYYDVDSSADRDNLPLLFEILRTLLKPFAWLFDQLEGLPDALRWLIVIVAALVCVALIAHIIYTLVSSIREPSRRGRAPRLKGARELDPGEFERQAEALGSQGDYPAAIRLLLRAALRRLELAEDRRFRPGFTNREVLRQYQAKPVFDALERLVRTIDVTWYGNQPCAPGVYADCQVAHAQIRDYAEEHRRAVAG